MDDIKKLYELYYRDIYGYIFSLTGNVHQTEDIVQNTFVTAIKAISSYKGLSSVKTWIIGISRNEYYTYMRKNPVGVDGDHMEHIAADSGDSREEYMSVIEEIRRLEEPKRQIAVLRLVNGMSFAEIGLVTGMSENYCRVTFFRIKNMLREVLKG